MDPDGGRAGQGGYARPVNLGAPELIIILIVVLVLFGGTKLPKLARSLGEAKKEFEAGVQESDKKKADEPDKTA
jgi:sec-independent protein translocase protein TatA